MIQMKKLFTLMVISSLVLACNSNSSSTPSGDSTTGTNATGVENVNGNVPDTTSGMQLNKSLPIDSSRVKDSSRH
jgi:hypothetical protein